ncbi:MAG: DNA mismatch repair endonuclease MutL, partial [Brevinematales bacterium]
LENLSSLGFRGEALASIASVATLDIMSRTKESLSGHRLVVCYGKAHPLQEVGMGYGTIVRVTDLFERIPARKKFLQSPAQEGKLVFKEIIKKMLVFPECGFSYRSDGKEKFRTPPRHTHLERIIDLFGDISDDVIPFSFEIDHAHIQGFLGTPTFLKPQRNMQFFSVNRRIVEWKSFPFVISQVYGNLIPTQKHPVVFVFVEMDASEVDINVHPMKKEVRFRQERKFQEALWQGMQKALQKTLMVSFSPSSVSSFDSSYLSQNVSPSWVVRESPSEEKTYSSSYPEPDFFPHDLDSSSEEESSNLLLQESFLSFHDYRYAGELFATYLLFEKEDEVIIIDQHAAHERIRYEEIKQAIQEKSPSQELFYPFSLVLTSDQYDEVFSHQDIFQSLGFEIEPFGGTTILLRSIPAVLSPNAAQEAFEACLAAIENGQS